MSASLLEVKIECAHDAIVRLKDLKPHPGNPNKHPPEQIRLLAKIIGAQGWRLPIVVSKRSGLIVAGHGRLLAAQALKLKEAPVDYQDFESEAEEIAHLIADNRIAELAEMDRSALRELAEQIDSGAFDMELTGFDPAALEELMTAAPPESDVDAEPQIDKAEELRKKWGVERGQIWELGEHRLMCGDSTKPSAVEKLISGIKADVMFTDPPYGVMYQSSKKNAISGDLSQVAIPLSFKVSIEVATSDNARLYVCGGSNNAPMYFSLFDAYCRLMPKIIVWVKDSFVMRPNNYHSQFEFIYFGWKGKGGDPKLWFGDRKSSDVWQFKRDDRKTYLHPTQKPASLAHKAIENSCPLNGTVFEPFSGSGSTIIACEQLGRKCRAMEIDPGYVAVAIERWHQATGKTPRLLNGN